MDSQEVKVASSHSLRACRVRVLSLISFLEKDWENQSPIWVMNCTLQLAEAAATLALEEVSAAVEVGAMPQSQERISEETLRSPDACKSRVVNLAHSLWKEQQAGRRAGLALELAKSAAVLARIKGTDATQELAVR